MRLTAAFSERVNVSTGEKLQAFQDQTNSDSLELFSFWTVCLQEITVQSKVYQAKCLRCEDLLCFKSL